MFQIQTRKKNTKKCSCALQKELYTFICFLQLCYITFINYNCIYECLFSATPPSIFGKLAFYFSSPIHLLQYASITDALSFFLFEHNFLVFSQILTKVLNHLYKKSFKTLSKFEPDLIFHCQVMVILGNWFIKKLQFNSIFIVLIIKVKIFYFYFLFYHMFE